MFNLEGKYPKKTASRRTRSRPQVEASASPKMSVNPNMDVDENGVVFQSPKEFTMSHNLV